MIIQSSSNVSEDDHPIIIQRSSNLSEDDHPTIIQLSSNLSSNDHPIYQRMIMQMTDDKVAAQSKVTLVEKLARHSTCLHRQNGNHCKQLFIQIRNAKCTTYNKYHCKYPVNLDLEYYPDKKKHPIALNLKLTKKFLSQATIVSPFN